MDYQAKMSIIAIASVSVNDTPVSRMWTSLRSIVIRALKHTHTYILSLTRAEHVVDREQPDYIHHTFIPVSHINLGIGTHSHCWPSLTILLFVWYSLERITSGRTVQVVCEAIESSRLFGSRIESFLTHEYEHCVSLNKYDAKDWSYRESSWHTTTWIAL